MSGTTYIVMEDEFVAVEKAEVGAQVGSVYVCVLVSNPRLY